MRSIRGGGEEHPHEEESSPVALQDPAERLEVALSSAFPAVDDAAPDPYHPEITEDATEIDSNLLRVVPAPKPIDFEALTEETMRYRRLIVRAGAVVSVATLLSIGGALLYHVMLVGLFWVGTMIRPTVNAGGSRGLGSDTGSGYIISDAPEGTPTNPAGTPALAPSIPPAKPTLPAVPPLVQPLPNPNELAVNQLNAPQQDMNIIAIPAGESPLGRIKPPTPTKPVPRNVAPPMPLIAPPDKSTPIAAAPTRGVISPVASAAGNGGNGGDDDAPINWFQPGQGTGAGLDGRGHGHIAGGDLEEPQPYLTPDLPMALTSAPKKDHMDYQVTVNAQGEITDVKLVESSGEADLDEMWRLQILRNWKYHAAHVGGKYREATASVTIRLTSR
ncbi:MAG TPA: TonB family protein [Phycisphaerae bacterium]|nr:TonB family protein [Phycisphaerae bacterium]